MLKTKLIRQNFFDFPSEKTQKVSFPAAPGSKIRVNFLKAPKSTLPVVQTRLVYASGPRSEPGLSLPNGPATMICWPGRPIDPEIL